jgi:hypothetical protein
MAAPRRNGNASKPWVPEFPWTLKGLGRLAEADMLYYNIPMAEQNHHTHHHHPGHAHPPSAVHTSLLRLSAGRRMAFAAALIALLWAAAYWAMR